jgi:hypothetical protein
MRKLREIEKVKRKMEVSREIEGKRNNKVNICVEKHDKGVAIEAQSRWL